MEDGAYIKDVNNVLGKFVGTWKGDYNNKNYEFKIIKYTVDNIGLKFKEDLLLIRYKIVEANGKVLENTLDLANDSPYVIHGSYYDNRDGGYVLYYQGRAHKCGQNGDLFISTYGTNDTKLQLFLSVNGEMHSNLCPNGAAQQILPTISMELIKQ